jgi:hypothetical protein
MTLNVSPTSSHELGKRVTHANHSPGRHSRTHDNADNGDEAQRTRTDHTPNEGAAHIR